MLFKILKTIIYIELEVVCKKSCDPEYSGKFDSIGCVTKDRELCYFFVLLLFRLRIFERLFPPG